MELIDALAPVGVMAASTGGEPVRNAVIGLVAFAVMILVVGLHQRRRGRAE